MATALPRGVRRGAPGPGASGPGASGPGRVADAVLGVLFAFGALVQLNDPDPLLWFAVYAVAAAVSLLSFLRRVPWWLPALLAAGTLAWAATLAPRVVGRVPFGSMFGAFEMRNVGIEESREMYGLLLIAAWMAFVAVRARRAARGTPSTPPDPRSA